MTPPFGAAGSWGTPTSVDWSLPGKQTTPRESQQRDEKQQRRLDKEGGIAKGSVRLDAMAEHFRSLHESRNAQSPPSALGFLGSALEKGSQNFLHAAVSSGAGKIGGPLGAFAGGFGHNLVSQMFKDESFGGNDDPALGGNNSNALMEAIVKLTEAVDALAEKMGKEDRHGSYEPHAVGKAVPVVKAAGGATPPTEHHDSSGSMMDTLWKYLGIAMKVAAALG